MDKVKQLREKIRGILVSNKKAEVDLIDEVIYLIERYIYEEIKHQLRCNNINLCKDEDDE